MDTQERCEHDYKRQPYAGVYQVYICAKCGDEYVRDVS